MKAKKSLGQNFLKSGTALKAIIEAGEVSDQDLVFEIGPGKGSLTEELLKAGATVLALEADPSLVSYLEQRFKEFISNKKLILIGGDIRNFNPEEIKSYGNQYKLIANIPYYLTGQIIKTFLSTTFQPTRAVLLVQKEVADRIISIGNKESILSLSVKVYGKPKKVMKVPARDFSPSPKVDSAILLISDISRSFFDEVDEEIFFNTIKKAFSYKRKTLLNNFSGDQKIKVEKLLEKENISKNIRAEDLTLSFWVKLSSVLV